MIISCKKQDIKEVWFLNKLERQKEIHAKGFGMGSLEFGKIKVGKKTLTDAALDLNVLKQTQKNYNSKVEILKALSRKDEASLRKISDYFYRTNGIYFRICNYFAQMYRYDWYIVDEVYDETVSKEKIHKEFRKALNFLDNSYIRKNCMDIALSVIKNGCYYGCIIPSSQGIIFQELPVNYCRSRYSVGHTPIIELNMRFFDEQFADNAYRLRVIKMFPEDIQKGYVLYKQKQLKPDYQGDTGSWYALEKGSAIKFDFGNGDIPLFASAIPALLDLEAAQELDRRKQIQKLLKIIVQKLPLDKNGDLIFDVDEAQDIHRNAVAMLSNAIGVDVLTTFADIDSIDISDKATTTTNDDLEKVERSLYNAFGTAQNIFNASGNLATTNSILNDEALCRTLLLQFTAFYDQVTQLMSSNPKKWKFRLYMLETTQYNYKELSKMYKEQTQLGYSKMLPQIALGQSQSFIINSCKFENEILKLHEIMIPPLMSSTMSSEDVLGRRANSNQNKSQKAIEGEEKTAGRPQKEDAEKSDKTIANKESMN